MFEQFHHIIEQHTDTAIIAKFVDDNYSQSEAEKVIRILKKAKGGTKVKVGEQDYIIEVGSDLNIFFPPPAIETKSTVQKVNTVESLKEILNDQSQIIQELRSNNRDNLNNKADSITLTMMNGEQVPFVKTLFPADTLESMLSIPEVNGRHQEWLNKFNLSDILEDFLNGIPQVHPALGYGSIEKGGNVLDGSRRLKSRILANKVVEPKLREPFSIYLPVDPNYVLSTANALFISKVAKKQKQLSSVERGFQYYDLTTGSDAIEQQDLAVIEQVDPSVITHLRRVAELPREWLDALPDVYMVKDSHIKTLYKLFKDVSATEHDRIAELIIMESDRLLEIESNIAKLTTALINFVVKSASDVASETASTNGKPKAILLLVKGRTKITIAEAADSEGVTILKMAKVPNEHRSILIEKISALINEHAKLM